MIEPGLEFFRSVTDGEGEAVVMQARYAMARRSSE